MTRLSPLLATLTVAILAFPTKADALGPVDIEVGARAGLATSPLGPLGFGIGGRGGISILGLYAGIDVIDYLGATAECGGCSSPPGQIVKQSRSALLYGFEAGYNLKFYLVTIRPQFGFGNFPFVERVWRPHSRPRRHLELYLPRAGRRRAGFPRSALRRCRRRRATSAHGAGLRVDGPRPAWCHLLTGATRRRYIRSASEHDCLDFLSDRGGIFTMSQLRLFNAEPDSHKTSVRIARATPGDDAIRSVKAPRR